MSAAAELFVRDGYEKTSVNGIVEKAGCSVGAFYGHFKSKQELASLIWAESTIEIIKESVEKGSRIKEFDAFIDYLIMRSISSYSNKLTNVLFTLKDCYNTLREHHNYVPINFEPSKWLPTVKIEINTETFQARCDIMSEFCLMPKDIYKSLNTWGLTEG